MSLRHRMLHIASFNKRNVNGYAAVRNISLSTKFFDVHIGTPECRLSTTHMMVLFAHNLSRFAH